MRHETGALVIGGDYRGLGVVRSLGRRGIPVGVLTDEHHIAATSRYACWSEPWPRSDEHRQLQLLLELERRYGLEGWVIIPTGDETMAVVARHHAGLSERFILTTPPWDAVCWAYDKRLTLKLASALGLDQPWTRFTRGRDELAALDCPFPVILKPAYKQHNNRFTMAKAWKVADRAALLARYDEASAYVQPELILVQELIPGGGESQLSYAALCQDGESLASVVARRTRQHPIDFGRSSSFVETVDDPEVERAATRLLRGARYTGLIEVEFKRDPRDGVLKLLDANPRVWGWHSIGRRAGVDFPYLLWRLARGQTVPETRGTAGVHWVRFVTDVPAVIDELGAGRLSLGAYLRSLRGPLEFAILAGDDPLPGLLEVPILCRIAWKRRRTGSI